MSATGGRSGGAGGGGAGGGDGGGGGRGGGGGGGTGGGASAWAATANAWPSARQATKAAVHRSRARTREGIPTPVEPPAGSKAVWWFSRPPPGSPGPAPPPRPRRPGQQGAEGHGRGLASGQRLAALRRRLHGDPGIGAGTLERSGGLAGVAHAVAVRV